MCMYAVGCIYLSPNRCFYVRIFTYRYTYGHTYISVYMCVAMIEYIFIFLYIYVYTHRVNHICVNAHTSVFKSVFICVNLCGLLGVDWYMRIFNEYTYKYIGTDIRMFVFLWTSVSMCMCKQICICIFHWRLSKYPPMVGNNMTDWLRNWHCYHEVLRLNSIL